MLLKTSPARPRFLGSGFSTVASNYSTLDGVLAMIQSKRSLQRLFVVAACLACLLFWHVSNLGGDLDSVDQSLNITPAPTALKCQTLPGANETLVVLRTGSTELEDRFPVHLSTLLRCFPHKLVFSDHEETYMGQHILDALDSVSPEIRESHNDFGLYRRIQSGGRAALQPSELSGAIEAFANMGGHAENPGWKLDKWKFMPMLNRTLHEYPDMKWYVFIEADTYILWSMMLQYLAQHDHTKPFYGGSQMFIANVLFAHGGSGFVVSQAAMRMAVDHYAANKAEIEKFTDGHWAGDCVLGKYVRESGVPFSNGWPHFQGDYPGLVPYARADGRSVPDDNLREWCFPTISYHHMSPDMIRALWEFEQQWIETHDVMTDVLYHKDVFTDHVMPQMMAPKVAWDNLSDNDMPAASYEECRAACESQADCKQYSFDEAGHCRTRADPRLGKAGHEMRSDWLQDRLLQFPRDMAPCDTGGWII